MRTKRKTSYISKGVARKAYLMHKGGSSYRSIADKLNISPATALRITKEFEIALDAGINPNNGLRARWYRVVAKGKE